MHSKKTRSSISSELFNELASKNVRKSARDYFIYFLTLMLSVCLFYSFNSVSTQFSSLGIEDKLNYLAFSSSMLNAFSVVVCVIMGALVVYANRFLLRRRKKEMGIYATLGMERKELNHLLMKETLRIGVFSLISGIALGIFAAQILSLLTAKLAGISLISYHFMISFKAIGLSVLFFGILFFFVHRFNIRELKKMSLLDMLYSERKNEAVSADRRGTGWLLAVLSVVLILGGYGAIVFLAEKNVFKGLALGGAMLMIGTLFFFVAVLRIAAGLMKKNTRFYFKRLNLFTTSQFSSRLKSESVSMAMTAILLFLALSLVMLGPGMGKYVINGIENAAPFDATIFYSPYVQENIDEPMELLNEEGFDIREFSDSYQAFWTYTVPSLDSDFLTGSGSLNTEYNGEEQEAASLIVMGDEDYNRMLAIQNKAPVHLREDEYAVSYAFPALGDKLEAFKQHSGNLTIGQNTLSLAPEGIYHHAWNNQNVLSESGTIIIPQNLTEGLKKYLWYLDFNLFTQSEDLSDVLHNRWLETYTAGFQMWTRQEAIVSLTADNLLTTYLGLYLGITFLITSGAVLAIQQLAHSADNVKRYKLLRKLGASGKDIKRSLTKQLNVYFGVPALLAVFHAVFVTGAIFKRLEGLTADTMLTIMVSGSLLVFTVYTVYYITTYLGSKRILQIK